MAGIDAKSTGLGSHSSGISTSATGSYSTATGYVSEASGSNSSAYGAHSFARSINSTAIGQNALAYSANTTSLGQNAQAVAQNSTAIGHNAIATGLDSLALGAHSNASGLDSIAIGVNALASNVAAIAIGRNAEAVAANSVAIGRNLRATGEGSFVAGIDAKADGLGAHSSGVTTQATGDYSTATGYYSESVTDHTSAYGAFSYARSQNSTALGANSFTGGFNATAVGFTANASGTRSSAFGANAYNHRDGTQTFGDTADGRIYLPGDVVTQTRTVHEVLASGTALPNDNVVRELQAQLGYTVASASNIMVTDPATGVTTYVRETVLSRNLGSTHVSIGRGTPDEADLVYRFRGLGLFEEHAYYTMNSANPDTGRLDPPHTPGGALPEVPTRQPTYRAQYDHDLSLGPFVEKKERSYDTLGGTRVVTSMPDGTLQIQDFGFDAIDELIGNTVGPETLRQRVTTIRENVARTRIDGAADARLSPEGKEARDEYLEALNEYLINANVMKRDEQQAARNELAVLQNAYSVHVSRPQLGAGDFGLRPPDPDPSGALLERTEYSYEAVGASDFQRQRWARLDPNSGDPLGERYTVLDDQILLKRDAAAYRENLRVHADSRLGDPNYGAVPNLRADESGTLYERENYFESLRIHGFDVAGVLGFSFEDRENRLNRGQAILTARGADGHFVLDTDRDGWISRGEIDRGFDQGFDVQHWDDTNNDGVQQPNEVTFIENGADGLTIRDMIYVYECVKDEGGCATNYFDVSTVDDAQHAREKRTIEDYIAAGTAETNQRRIRNVDEFLTDEGKELLSEETLEALQEAPLGSTPKRYGDLYERNAWVQDKIDEHDREISSLREGVAMAAAMRTTHVERGRRLGFDINFSEYRGDYGVAGSMAMRVTENVQFHFSGATTSEFNEKLFRTGLNFQW